MKLPDMDQNHLSLHRHPEVSLEVVEETLLILQESQDYFLLELVDAVSRFRIESFRVDFRCVHRLQLLKVCDQYVTLPNSSPRTERIRGIIQVKLSFQIDGFATDPSQL